jgi:drug/metabolite transporter (DMT)-like permease
MKRGEEWHVSGLRRAGYFSTSVFSSETRDGKLGMKAIWSNTDSALLAVYAIASVSSLLLLKTALPEAQQIWARGTILSMAALTIGLGVLLYGVSFLTWMVILSRQELSVVYPLAIGLTLAFSTLGAAALLDEAVSALRVLGILLIFAGLVCVVRN